MSTIDIILNILLALSLLGLAVFGVTYARNARWRAYQSGRAMMWLVVSMALVLGNGFVSLVFGESEVTDWVRLVLYSNLTLSIWHFVNVLFIQLRIDPFYMLKIPRKWRKKQH